MSEARGLFAAQAEDNCWKANFGFPAEEFGESHSRRSRSRQCQPIIVVSRPDNYSCEEAPLHVPREEHTNREWSFKDTGYPNGVPAVSGFWSASSAWAGMGLL